MAEVIRASVRSVGPPDPYADGLVDNVLAAQFLVYPFREVRRASVATRARSFTDQAASASLSNLAARASSLSTSAAKCFFKPCGVSLVTSDS
jgi:hypothetical protein